VDLIHQGEFLADGQPLQRTPTVKNPREAAAYTFGYNPAVFAQRVQDALAAIMQARRRGGDFPLALVAVDGAAPIAAAARLLAGGALTEAVLAPGDFRFGRVLDLRSPDFLPGGARYGDLPSLLELGRGRLKLVQGVGEVAAALGE
jgi:broad specificity phosphatase PhoE